MPRLLSNEDFLSSLKEHVAATKASHEALAATGSENNLIPADLPEALKEWLAQLALLYGVPFDHLVCNESL